MVERRADTGTGAQNIGTSVRPGERLHREEGRPQSRPFFLAPLPAVLSAYLRRPLVALRNKGFCVGRHRSWRVEMERVCAVGHGARLLFVFPQSIREGVVTPGPARAGAPGWPQDPFYFHLPERRSFCAKPCDLCRLGAGIAFLGRSSSPQRRDARVALHATRSRHPTVDRDGCDRSTATGIHRDRNSAGHRRGRP